MSVVVELRPDQRRRARREADRIAAARPDAVLSLVDQAMAAHPSVVSKQRQAARQQILGSLVAIVGAELTSDEYLPLIVDVLLRTCPQSKSDPALVAKSLEEAAAAWTQAQSALSEDDRRAVYAAESAFIVSQLASGTAVADTSRYAMRGCQQLADWLTAAVVER